MCVSSEPSAGHDSISSNLLKHKGNTIACPLSMIINQSLSTGIFPDKLKSVQVIPIYNKGIWEIIWKL